MSKVAAHWELAREIVELRNEISPETLIIFNGDVKDLSEARLRTEETGCDGVMLGRAIFGNPYLFSNSHELENDISKKLNILVEHTKLFEELLPGKNFAIMKKHFKAYVKDFDGAAELRAILMETSNPQEVEKAVDNFLNIY